MTGGWCEHAQRGFSIRRGIIERTLLQSIRDRVISRFGDERGMHPVLPSSDPYESAFFARSNVWQTLDEIRELWLASPLADHICDLFGERRVRLSHDHLFWKRPGDASTPVHADQYGIPIANARVLTAWVPLQTASPESGCICYYDFPGGVQLSDHTRLGKLPVPKLASTLNALGAIVKHAHFSVGDVAFHDGWTYHGAYPNHSEQCRIAIAATYFSEHGVIATPASGHSPTAIAERHYGSAPIGTRPPVTSNPFTRNRR